MGMKRPSAAELMGTVLNVAEEATGKRRRSRRALKALAVGTGGIAGLVAASAGISELRRRRGEPDDG
jgi:hypothetical protein